MLKDILNRDTLVTVEPDARINDVARVMSERDVGCVLVLTNGRPRGMLTDRDIVLRCVAENVDVNDTTVEQVMTETVETCGERDGIFDCIRKMRDAGVRRMPVVDEHGKVTGLVSFGDLLAVLSREFVELTRTTTPAENSLSGRIATRRAA